MTNSLEATVTCLDVAGLCLDLVGPVTAMKLQKIVYYCQAWHLALLDKPLFGDHIEAWAYGPVMPVLFAQHRGMFVVKTIESHLRKPVEDKMSQLLIRWVVDTYNRYSGKSLGDMTHGESPWLMARKEPDGFPDNSIISHESMTSFYKRHSYFCDLQQTLKLK
jgi:uncharacterized phage-associated protein